MIWRIYAILLLIGVVFLLTVAGTAQAQLVRTDGTGYYRGVKVCKVWPIKGVQSRHLAYWRGQFGCRYVPFSGPYMLTVKR